MAVMPKIEFFVPNEIHIGEDDIKSAMAHMDKRAVEIDGYFERITWQDRINGAVIALYRQSKKKGGKRGKTV